MKILGFDLAANYSSIAIQAGDEFNGFTQMHDVRARPAWEDLFAGIGFSAPDDLKDLDAISFAQGPGSYTALRNIATFLKPIAHLNNIPLVPISSLQAFALSAFDFMEDPLQKLHTAIDAQKGTCYFASYSFEDGIPQPFTKEEIVDVSMLPQKATDGYCIGNAWKDYSNAITHLSEVTPHAGSVCRLASLADFQSNAFLPSEANPVYLEPLTFRKINE